MSIEHREKRKTRHNDSKKKIYMFFLKKELNALAESNLSYLCHTHTFRTAPVISVLLQFFQSKMASRYPTNYFKVNDDANHKVYSHDCQHVLSEVVSTRKFPLCCLRHVPVYIFKNIDDKIFLHFHWVSNTHSLSLLEKKS